MNTTTKAQRDQWRWRATQLIKMDHETRVTNVYAVQAQLMREYGVSRDSALSAIAQAVLVIRGKMI